MTESGASIVGFEAIRHRVALLLVDVINDFEFPGSDALLPLAAEAVPRIEALLVRARGFGVPIVYVNDNFGHWRSDFRATIARCTDHARPGAALVQRLGPRPEDYFVLKPKQSGFFHTPLELLLKELGTETVVICGFATNACVTSTAHDAHMRDLRVVVPHDTTAAITRTLCADSVRHLELSLLATTCAASEVDFERLGGGYAAPLE